MCCDCARSQPRLRTWGEENAAVAATPRGDRLAPIWTSSSDPRRAAGVSTEYLSSRSSSSVRRYGRGTLIRAPRRRRRLCDIVN